MKKELVRKSSEESFITYEHFAKTYLFIAKNVLLEKENNNRKKELSIDDNFRIDSGLVVIPAIYCVRHSIELFLKSIDVGRTSTYLQTHDTRELVKILDTVEGLSVSVKNEVIRLAAKYFDYRFSVKLTDNLKNGASDLNNEVFRFPENNAEIAIIGTNLPAFNVIEILQDIKDLGLVFGAASGAWQLSESRIKNRN